MAATLRRIQRHGRRLGQAVVDAFAHLLDQGLQHAHLGGQLLRAGDGAAFDGLGQFGQGALRRLHRIGQQAVGLSDLADLLFQGAALDRAGDDCVKGAEQAQRA